MLVVGNVARLSEYMFIAVCQTDWTGIRAARLHVSQISWLILILLLLEMLKRRSKVRGSGWVFPENSKVEWSSPRHWSRTSVKPVATGLCQAANCHEKDKIFPKREELLVNVFPKWENPRTRST